LGFDNSLAAAIISERSWYLSILTFVGFAGTGGGFVGIAGFAGTKGFARTENCAEIGGFAETGGSFGTTRK